jgi:hypothetical protein
MYDGPLLLCLEDGTEEYTTPSLLASQQDFTPNSDATHLRLDSPYQPKGVYRQRRKNFGSLSFHLSILGSQV